MKVRLYATLRDIAGGKEITVDFNGGGTARELMDAICEANPALGERLLDEDGKPTGFAHIFVDGRNVMWLEDMETIVTDEHDVDLIPPVAGGAR